ncbi:hypothetical protein FIBSPDRAFT_726645, partial [Athelia psychrophila]
MYLPSRCPCYDIRGPLPTAPKVRSDEHDSISTGLDISASDNTLVSANFVRVLNDPESHFNASTVTESLTKTPSRKPTRSKPIRSHTHVPDLTPEEIEPQPKINQAPIVNSNLARDPEPLDIDWTNIEVTNFRDWIPEHDDIILVPPPQDDETAAAQVFTAYKTVDRKIKPVPATFPESARVVRTIPTDPLLTLPALSPNPPKFQPSQHLTQERLDSLEINKENFLSEEEERLFEQVMQLNEKSLAFEETDRGTMKDSYFSPYIMPVVPHTPWEDKNIPIPP